MHTLISTVHPEVDVNDKLIAGTAALIRRECPGFMSPTFKSAKAVEIKNRKCLIMNIVNLFTHLRMKGHYMEMLERQYPSFIRESTSTPTSHAEKSPVEPFTTYDDFSIREFLDQYPLFEVLRKYPKCWHAIKWISASVSHIINKVMRPLPFQPTHIINDSYADFLFYSTMISKFVHHKIETAHAPDDIILRSPVCPIQLDFMIIPQCVSESKIGYENAIITDYDEQCDRLPFAINDQIVGDIGEHLRKCGVPFVERQLDREPAQFHKILSRSFDKMANKGRHQRFIFVIDRRNPKFDGKYCLRGSGKKDWPDRLYIFCPHQYNQISTQCDNVPEGFIDRTMEYLLPLNANSVIGANCVANGYVFALSYHLYQADKLKAYFHSNGCVQRFTKDEAQYYFPRLFMKVNGKFQDELKANKRNNQSLLDMFKEINDVEHAKFHQQTMR